MEIDQLIAALAPAEVLRPAPVKIPDLAYDARAAGPGSLFFCVPGTRADGHEFAADAVGNGAVALVVERPLELDVPQLVVPNARAAMPVAADEFFGRPTEELKGAGGGGATRDTPAPPPPLPSTHPSPRPAAGRGYSARSRAASGASAARRPGRRPRQSTSSASSARCSMRATAARLSRPPRTAPRSAGSTGCASARSSSRT